MPVGHFLSAAVVHLVAAFYTRLLPGRRQSIARIHRRRSSNCGRDSCQTPMSRDSFATRRVRIDPPGRGRLPVIGPDAEFAHYEHLEGEADLHPPVQVVLAPSLPEIIHQVYGPSPQSTQEKVWLMGSASHQPSAAFTGRRDASVPRTDAQPTSSTSQFPLSCFLATKVYITPFTFVLRSTIAVSAVKTRKRPLPLESTQNSSVVPG